MKIKYIKKIANIGVNEVARWKENLESYLEKIKDRNRAFDLMIGNVFKELDEEILSILHQIGKVKVPKWDNNPKIGERSRLEHPKISSLNLEQLREYTEQVEWEKNSMEQSLIKMYQKSNGAKKAIESKIDKSEDLFWKTTTDGVSETSLVEDSDGNETPRW